MPEPESQPDGQKDPKGNLPDEVTRVLEDIKAKLSELPEKPEASAGPTAPTLDEQRALLQKKLGFNDDQMAAHEQTILRAQAPVIEQSGWDRLEKKPDIENFRKEIEKELSIYPQERRTPDIMQKIYYYVKGMHADSKPPEKRETPPGSGSERIVRGPGYTGAEPNLGGGDDREKAGDEKLTEIESFVANKLGVAEKDYARAKRSGREVWQMKPADTRESRSLADLELKRLTSR